MLFQPDIFNQTLQNQLPTDIKHEISHMKQNKKINMSCDNVNNSNISTVLKV